MAWLGPLLSLLGAFAPTFEILVATQTLARPMGIALAILIGVVAAEEMPDISMPPEKAPKAETRCSRFVRRPDARA